MHDEAACGAGGERESYAKMAKRWGVDQGGSAVNKGGFVNVSSDSVMSSWGFAD